MATVAEVLAKIAEVKSNVLAEIQALKDKIETGSGITVADLDGILAAVDAVDEGLPSEGELPVEPTE